MQNIDLDHYIGTRAIWVYISVWVCSENTQGHIIYSSLNHHISNKIRLYSHMCHQIYGYNLDHIRHSYLFLRPNRKEAYNCYISDHKWLHILGTLLRNIWGIHRSSKTILLNYIKMEHGTTHIYHQHNCIRIFIVDILNHLKICQHSSPIYIICIYLRSYRPYKKGQSNNSILHD